MEMVFRMEKGGMCKQMGVPRHAKRTGFEINDKRRAKGDVAAIVTKVD